MDPTRFASTAAGPTVSGLLSWLVILAVLGVVAVLFSVYRLRWSPLLGRASDEQARAFAEGVRAFGEGLPRRAAPRLPRGLKRWWRQGYRDAGRFGVEAALAQLELREGA